jgi:hypothetical protein
MKKKKERDAVEQRNRLFPFQETKGEKKER